jgi:hypothetical protein
MQGLYNLYPRLVHVRLFGSGYLTGIDATLAGSGSKRAKRTGGGPGRSSAKRAELKGMALTARASARPIVFLSLISVFVRSV